jgi:2'-5' RNA ligase
LWAGLSADDSLNRLYLGLEEEMAKLGYNKENRPFSPHLTLTRIPYLADETAMEATLKHLFAARDREFGSVMVRRITLFQSTLAAGGSIYSPLAFFQLHE